MAHEVFISHSSEDKATADLVCAALEEAGLSCWIAPRDVRPGQFFPGEIKRAIERCRVMVLIFSAHSNNSLHVLREIDFATRAHAHIVNFRIERVTVSDDLDYFLALPHWLDALTPPTKECLAQLVGSTRGLLALPPRGPGLPAHPNDPTAPRPADATAVRAVFVAPESPATAAASERAALRRKRRALARTFTDAALQKAREIGFRAVDDFQLLEPLIRVLAKAGDENGALSAATETGGGFRDFALSIIAETQVHDGDEAAARRTAATCQEKGDALARVARALAETGDTAGALRVAEEISAAGFQACDPRAVALSQIAGAQAKTGDVDGALHTVAAIDVSSPNRFQQKEARRCREAALSRIAEAQAQAGDVAGAARTLAEIEDAKVRLRAQNKACVARARGGDVPGALAVATEGRYDRKDWVLGCIAEVQAQTGDFDAATRTLNGIEDDYRRDEGTAALAVAHARTGDFPVAADVIKEIVNSHVRRRAHARLAVAHAEAGDPVPVTEYVKTLPALRDRIKMCVASAALLLDDPANTRWWMDFVHHHLWD